MNKPANKEMVDGYRDGRDKSNPMPSDNRTHSYRHGFGVGRREVNGEQPVGYDEAIKQADRAMAVDAADDQY